jgi:hypothetical protein
MNTKHCAHKRLYKSHGQGVIAAAILVFRLSMSRKQHAQQKHSTKNILSLIRLNLNIVSLLFSIFSFEGEIFYLPFRSCLDLFST